MLEGHFRTRNDVSLDLTCWSHSQTDDSSLIIKQEKEQLFGPAFCLVFTQHAAQQHAAPSKSDD